MSFVILKSDLEQEHKELIREKCIVQLSENTQIKTYVVNNNEIRLPFALWDDLLDEFPNTQEFDKMFPEFVGKPSKNQEEVLELAQNQLSKTHRVFLALGTGYGKTFCSLWLACKLGYKTVVLCHSSTLHKQWVGEIEKYCRNISTQIVKNKLKDYADVYIMGIRKATHIDKHAFSRIGVVIIDETHLTYTDTFAKALLQFEPKYIIGLSATPDRKSGGDAILYPFFGSRDEFIFRMKSKEFTVVKCKSYFKPDVKYTIKQGKSVPDWTSVINSLSYNKERQRVIAKLVDKIIKGGIEGCDTIGKKMIILCQRVDAIFGIVGQLQELRISTDYVNTNKATYNDDCLVLIGTDKKLGVGFDSKREILILESDMKDVRQAEGRIRVDGGYVFDIVDDYGILEKHWKMDRLPWYLHKKAKILQLKL